MKKINEDSICEIGYNIGYMIGIVLSIIFFPFLLIYVINKYF